MPRNRFTAVEKLEIIHGLAEITLTKSLNEVLAKPLLNGKYFIHEMVWKY